MTGTLNQNEFESVCRVVSARMGLNFPPDRWPMLGRNLITAASEFGFHTQKSFIHWLLKDDLSKIQTYDLASHLTITETYFWREHSVFDALTAFILPNLINSKRESNKTIRIWSAGCSTGEEPYSLAIALHQVLPDIKDWKIKILATDINPKALDKAASAIYTAWSFRNCPGWLIPNYFTHKEDGSFELIPAIRKMVTFATLNLAELDFPSRANNTNDMDIIFCRNVLMYFSSDWVDKIVKKLGHSLGKEGWFAVSSCELNSQVFPDFKAINFPGAVIYHHGERSNFEIPSNLPQNSSHQTYTTIRNSLSKEVVPLPLPEIDKTVTAIQTLMISLPEEHSADPVPVQKIENIDIIRLLADQGHLLDALSRCEAFISSDKLNKDLYYLRSTILMELDRKTDSVASLKQAIYLDPDFIMGHFALGNLYVKLGKTKMAIRYLQNAVDLLEKCSGDFVIPESEGLAARYIREMVVSNLQTQKMI